MTSTLLFRRGARRWPSHDRHQFLQLTYSPFPAFKLEALIDMASNASAGKGKDGKETNMEVDYVFSYRFAITGRFIDLGFRVPITDEEKRKQRQL